MNDSTEHIFEAADRAFEEGFTGKPAVADKAAEQAGTAPLKFSDEELKAMDADKADLEKGYAKQFSHYNRGKPPTERQLEHAEHAATIVAAQRMMAAKLDRDGRGQGYSEHADMVDVGDAAALAVEANRKRAPR